MYARVLSLVKHPTTSLHKWLLVILVAAVAILTIALYSRPFLSERTLMGNLEPFPDTFYYLVPAQNLVNGHGLVMYRDGGTPSAPAVPPLYSLALAPFFLLQNDPRWFYVVNLLSLAGATFFLGKALKKITRSNEWTVLGLFLFLTNHFIIWIPSLAMAECLLLLVFSFAVWLLVSPLTQRRIALAAMASIALYATKYAAAPLTLVFGLAYLAKILAETQLRLNKIKQYDFVPLAIYFASGFFALIFFMCWQKTFTQKSIFDQLVSQITIMLPFLSSVETTTTTASTNIFFSMSFFWEHWPQYWKTFIGQPGRFLWDTFPFTSFLTGITALGGTVLLLKNKTTRLLGIFVSSAITAQTAFMSTFYTFDLRYVLTHLPLILLASCYLGSRIVSKKLLSLFIVCAVIGVVTLLGLKAYKLRIVLNLKYQETPWWYLSIKEHDAFFKDADANTVLISASNPYHYDFFRKSTFTLLPLSLHQDFARTEGSADQTWGKNEYGDLLALYEKYLTNGAKMYVTNWGLGNEQPLHRDFKAIEEHFTLKKVREGCLGACNLYELHKI